jgi:hypothetical protein
VASELAVEAAPVEDADTRVQEARDARRDAADVVLAAVPGQAGEYHNGRHVRRRWCRRAASWRVWRKCPVDSDGAFVAAMQLRDQ